MNKPDAKMQARLDKVKALNQKMSLLEALKKVQMSVGTYYKYVPAKAGIQAPKKEKLIFDSGWTAKEQPAPKVLTALKKTSDSLVELSVETEFGHLQLAGSKQAITEALNRLL